jgi:para-nitrobenzyl esterase
VDLPFCFHNLHTPSTPYLIGDDAPAVLADTMHDAWIAFIRSGDPATGATGDWPRYCADRRPTMIFDTESHLTDDPLSELRRHWLGG